MFKLNIFTTTFIIINVFIEKPRGNQESPHFTDEDKHVISDFVKPKAKQ